MSPGYAQRPTWLGPRGCCPRTVQAWAVTAPSPRTCPTGDLSENPPLPVAQTRWWASLHRATAPARHRAAGSRVPNSQRARGGPRRGSRPLPSPRGSGGRARCGEAYPRRCSGGGASAARSSSWRCGRRKGRRRWRLRRRRSRKGGAWKPWGSVIQGRRRGPMGTAPETPRAK